MKYPEIAQWRDCIKNNLFQINLNRSDLYYALLGTGIYDGYVSNSFGRDDYLSFLKCVCFFTLNKTNPFDNLRNQD